MSTTPEGVVKRAVKKILATTRLWYFMPVQNGMGRVGIPDFVGCLPYVIRPEDVGKTVGLFFSVETKAPGKLDTLTANQKRETDGIRAAAGLVQVVDDARNLCLPISNHGKINTPQARIPEALQRPAGDGQSPRKEQCRAAPAHARRARPCRRRQGRSAQPLVGPWRLERSRQPNRAVT